MTVSSLRSLLAIAFAAALAAASLHAQAVSFAGAQTNVGYGYSQPYGVAVDPAGNLYVADSGNGRILEFLFDNPGPITRISSGLPTGQFASTAVAADKFGNVFITDTGGDRLLEMSAGSFSMFPISVSGMASPVGEALIPGNLYIVDSVNNNILEEPTIGGQPTVILKTGLLTPIDVAVDSLGDLLIADYGNNRVVRYSPTTTDFAVVLTDLSMPQGVALDADDNLFVSDSGNNQVLMLPPGASSPVPVGTGFSNPTDLAIDRAGSLYIADSGNNRIVRLQLRSVDFGMAGMCGPQQTVPQSCGGLITLNFNVTADGSLGPTRARTVGAPGLDFSIVGKNTCTGAVTEGTQCSVDVMFSPKFPGPRKGVIQITDSAGKVISTTYVSGYGHAPQIVFGPGPQSTVGTGLNEPLGMAADEAGNLYIADDFNNRVVKISSKGVQTTVGTGFSKPTAVALDGAGNLYVADWGNNRVVKVPSDGSAQSTIGSGFLGPQALTVDRAGNVIVADTNNSQIVEVPANGDPQFAIGTGFSFPHGVAVDYFGNVFVSDFANHQLAKVPAGCDGSYCQIVVDTTINGPSQMILDPAGDLLVADYYNNRVVEFPADGSSSRTVGRNLTGPQGLAMNPAGDLYISESGKNTVVKLARSSPALQVFPTPTLINTTDSADGKYTLEIENIGNEPLGFSAPASGSNPSYPASFPVNAADSNLCQSGQTVQPGSICDISFAFRPVFGGVNTGSIRITDNALNQADVTQSIPLQGTGFQKQTISFPPIIGKEYALKTVALKATASSGLTVVFTSATAKICTVSGATAKLLGSGTCTIQASQPGSIAYSAAPKVSESFNVLRIAQTIAFPAITAKEYARSNFKLKATANSALAVSFTSTTPKVCTVSGVTASLLIGGTCTITASQAGNAVYNSAVKVSRSITVSKATQAITFPPIASQVVGTKLALKASSTSKLAVVFASTTPKVCTVSGTTASMIATGTCTITASQSGNAAYAAAASISRSFAVAPK